MQEGPPVPLVERRLFLLPYDHRRLLYDKKNGRYSEQGVDGKAVRKNYKCQSGDTVRFSLPEPEETELVAQDIPLDVVFEDNDVIVINKPRGMVVHPAAGHPL